MMRRFLHVFFGTAFCMNSSAVEIDVPEAASSKEAEVVQPFPFDRIAMRLYAGNFVADHEQQFESLRNQYAFGFGISARNTRYPALELDVEYFFVNRDYDTVLASPVFGTIDNDSSVETQLLLAGGRLVYPHDSVFHVYAVAGLGLFKTRLEVHGSTFGLPVALEEDVMDMDIYYGAGAEIRYRQWSLSFNYRHFDLKGNFDDFQVQSAEIGGDVLAAGVGVYF